MPPPNLDEPFRRGETAPPPAAVQRTRPDPGLDPDRPGGRPIAPCVAEARLAGNAGRHVPAIRAYGTACRRAETAAPARGTSAP